MGTKFVKMQAFGNDYVYIDAISQNIEQPGLLSKKISDRHFGIGSDGLVLICPSETCDLRMRIFNPDGTEAQMCGNALRSTAKFAYHFGITDKTAFTVETMGGRQYVELTVKDGQVVDVEAIIGRPEFEAVKVPVKSDRKEFFHQPIQVADRVFQASALSWGNPHTVVLVEDVSCLAVEKYGPIIEHLQIFPERTNVTFAQPVDEGHIKIREWERGTGETLGCGTGCCSAVVVLHRLGLCGRVVDVEQPGGVLHVEWDREGLVHMKGPSYIVYQGEFVDETI